GGDHAAARPGVPARRGAGAHRRRGAPAGRAEGAGTLLYAGSMTGLRWGILATGGIAAAFASDLRTAGLDLVAVGSRSQESADAFAARFDIPRAHGSYEAL